MLTESLKMSETIRLAGAPGATGTRVPVLTLGGACGSGTLKIDDWRRNCGHVKLPEIP